MAAWGQLDKAAVETCICAVALSLSVVMAGSGHLQTMRLIRGAHSQPVSTRIPPLQCLQAQRANLQQLEG